MFVPLLVNLIIKYTKKMKTTTAQQSLIRNILNDTAKFGFKPSVEFYDKVQINRKRWVLLLDGKKEPTVAELKSICVFFEANIKNYI